MLHTYIPTLTNPTENSQKWYKELHNTFYISQINSQIFENVLELCIKFKYLSDCKNEISDSNQICDKKWKEIFEQEIDFLADIIQEIDFLADIIIEENFENHENFMTAIIRAMMLSVDNPPYKKNIHINSKELLCKIGLKNWYDASLTFLRIWEYLFLFANIESAFKQILVDQKIICKSKKSDSKKYINQLLNHYKLYDQNNIVIGTGIRKQLIEGFWVLFCSIRDIYVHKHGFISDENILVLQKKLIEFRREYEKYIESNPSLCLLLPPNKDQIFPDNTLQSNKLLLINNIELNIFRNFTTQIAELINNKQQERVSSFENPTKP